MSLKTPGESDGSAQGLGAGGSEDSVGSSIDDLQMLRAGGWSDYMAKMLAKNEAFYN